MIENLAFLAKKRKEEKIQALRINYVLSSKNIAELNEMVLLCRENYVDVINVVKLFDLGTYTEEMFEKMSIVDEESFSIKPEYKKYFTKELLDDPIINWASMAPYVGKKACFRHPYSGLG